LSRKTRRCVHCDAARQTGGSGLPDWSGRPGGLSHGIDRNRLLRPRAARELEAGTVWINEHLAVGSERPHGEVEGSGFRKDMSMYALEEYTVVKHVVFELTGAR
jgi:acyl-CoA reductase-like NAD-dependent aldehyde dehydrogenase